MPTATPGPGSNPVYTLQPVIPDLIRDPLAVQSGMASGSRIARFANETEDLGQTGFREDEEGTPTAA